MSATVYFFFLAALLMGSLGGLVTASILKNLDNIVKEYSGNLANVITAVVSAFLFPDKFEINAFIVVSMTFLFAGIYFYERGKNAGAAGSGKAATAGAERSANNETGMAEANSSKAQGIKS